MLGGPRTLTVAQLTEYISRVIQGDPKLTDLTVTGELSNFVHHSSGHMYFTLKDRESSIKGVMFQTWNRRLPFRPENGQEVFVRGDVVVYKRGGNYQLNVYAMEPAGQGALALAFAQLKERLMAEGLFEQGRKLPLPKFPGRVGLITSPQGAALQDFLITAAQQAWPVTIELAPATVQGEKGASSVVSALNMLNRRKVDVIVITRGGGSLEELWVFNEESVARAVAASRIPVVSAIGHETDFTICDFASSARAATPTAVAKLVIPDRNAVLDNFQQQRHRMERALFDLVSRRRQRLNGLALRPLLSRPLQILLQPRQNLDHMTFRFKSEFAKILQGRRHHLSGLAARLADLNPLSVLARGFSVVRHDKGIIKSVNQISIGQNLSIQFQDGVAEVSVLKLGEE